MRPCQSTLALGKRQTTGSRTTFIDALTRLYEIPDPTKRKAEAPKIATAANKVRIAERDQIKEKSDTQARIFQQFDDATFALAIQWTEQKMPGGMTGFSTLPPSRKSEIVVNVIVKMNGDNQTAIKNIVSHDPACAGRLTPPTPPAAAVKPLQPGTLPKPGQPPPRLL